MAAGSIQSRLGENDKLLKQELTYRVLQKTMNLWYGVTGKGWYWNEQSRYNYSI
jgi:hypothetical protein